MIIHRRNNIMSNLPEKMKALVAYAPGDYRLETVDTPRAGKGERHGQSGGRNTVHF